MSNWGLVSFVMGLVMVPICVGLSCWADNGAFMLLYPAVMGAMLCLWVRSFQSGGFRVVKAGSSYGRGPRWRYPYRYKAIKAVVRRCQPR